MAKSDEPGVWMPFAAGGMVAALAVPALIAATGLLLPLGLFDLEYDSMRTLLAAPLAKLVALGLIALPAWHAAHRIQATVHDLGWGGGRGMKRLCYGTAIAVAATAALALIRL